MKKIGCLVLTAVMLSQVILPSVAISTDETQVFNETEYEDIYVSDGQYYMYVGESDKEVSTFSFEASNDKVSYIPVDKIDVDFGNAESVSEFLNREDIPVQIREDVERVYQEVLVQYDEELSEVPEATLFAPVNYASGDDPDEIIRYTYNGWPMMSYRFVVTNRSSGWEEVKTGRGTKDTIKFIKEVTFAVASEASETLGKLSFLSTGKTILDAYLEYVGLSANQLTTSTQDYFQARIIWDQVTQYTMIDSGDYSGPQCGLVTYKITVKKLGHETYFANSGEGPRTVDRNISKIITSPHYYNPWATAFNNGQYTEWEYLRWEVDNIHYEFT